MVLSVSHLFFVSLKKSLKTEGKQHYGEFSFCLSFSSTKGHTHFKNGGLKTTISSAG